MVSISESAQFHSLFESYTQVDQIVPYLVRIGMLNRFNGPCIALATILGIFMDHFMHFRRFNYVWRLPHEVMNVIPQDFVALNPGFKFEFDLRHPQTTLASLKKLFTLWSLPHSSSVKFRTPKLRYYPNSPMELRTRAILVNWTLNVLFIFVWLLAGIWSYSSNMWFI